jgi:translocation and assembly module TamA
MIENIEVSLSLYAAIGKPQGAARMEYLLSQAERQTRDALEPFGYYTPSITVEAPRDGDHLTVPSPSTRRAGQGAPRGHRHHRAGRAGPLPGRGHRRVQARVGERFDHVAYEGSKITITRRLADRGYFDADFTQRRVEVTRAEHAADIFLTWDSGRRYDMGPVTFHQDYFRPGLFDPLVYWDRAATSTRASSTACANR